jgi:flavorubredoxin
MRAVPVADGIHWVGVIDWNLRDFHGYDVARGTTYNSYLVQGADKIALVDTVKTAFVPELLERLVTLVRPEDVDYIVVNHIEPDHGSGLRLVAEAMPNAKIVASAGGVKGIAEYHGSDLEVSAVGADDSLDLGGVTLHFAPMPMVHWPDSMFTYCPERRVLMPNDGFGQHLASSARFADEVGLELAMEELVTYYANILQPLGRQVAKAVQTVVERGWECDVIAPSHGVIWRGDDVGRAIEAYGRYTSGETTAKLIVAYSTMWGATDVMARAIADGATEAGACTYLYDLAVTPYAKIVRHLFDGRALLLGSPTLHHGILYRTGGFLQYIAGLKPADKIAGAFGSYGWSSGATKQMTERLTDIGFQMPFPDFTVKYALTEEDVEAARQWGAQFGRQVVAGPPVKGD